MKIVRFSPCVQPSRDKCAFNSKIIRLSPCIFGNGMVWFREVFGQFVCTPLEHYHNFSQTKVHLRSCCTGPSKYTPFAYSSNQICTKISKLPVIVRQSVSQLFGYQTSNNRWHHLMKLHKIREMLRTKNTHKRSIIIKMINEYQN